MSPDHPHIRKLVATLRSPEIGVEADWRDLADVLWLAAVYAGKGFADGDAEPGHMSRDDYTPDEGQVEPAGSTSTDHALEQVGAAPGGDTPAAEPDGGWQLTGRQGGETEADGMGLDVAAPSWLALPGRAEIGRALRPLKRHRPSPRRRVLDAEATVDQFCDSGVLVPVVRPALERLFEVAIVLDGSPTTSIWRGTVAALADLLERHGAFRAVRRWTLRERNGQPVLLSQAGVEHMPHALTDVSGQRLVLVITDGVDTRWTNDTFWAAVRLWGSWGPVALVHLLPDRLWGQTAIGEADVAVRSTRPGAANVQLDITPPWWWDKPGPLWGAIPMIGLDEESVAPWARLVAGVPGVAVRAVLGIAPDRPGGEDRGVPREILGDMMRSSVSAMAYRLAALLSAVDVSLPVARVVMAHLLPEARQVHLAELLAAGILLGDVDTDDEASLDFAFGVREVLQETLTTTDILSVWRAVTPFLQASRRNPPFALLLTGGAGAPMDAETAMEEDRMARIAADLVERLADQLTSTGDLRAGLAADTWHRAEPVSSGPRSRLHGRMTRVCLSSAMEDGAAAGRLHAWLRDKGFEVIWWQDDEHWRDGPFAEEIENGIASADFFVAVMSPHYLASSWCRRERILALQRESDSGPDARFIHVVKVADTEYAQTGMLSSYAWLDLVPPIDDGKLEAISRALYGARPAAAPGAAPRTPFRNRQDELNTVRGALSVTGGHDLWLIVSPPRLGKSWFLDRLQRDLRTDGWTVRLLDLREQPLDLRTNPGKLLGRLLDEDETLRLADPTQTSVQLTLAARIANRRRRQAYFLDSAELLEPSCAATFRAALTGVYGLVSGLGITQTQIAVVVGSRRDDDWKGLARGGGAGARFKPVALNEFGVEVVHQALAELDRDLGAERLRDCARRLLRLSEGLPALLVRGVQWAEENAFLEMDQSDQHATFEYVAGPYITDDLLSVDSLLPFGGHNLGQAQELLTRALRVLVVYRLFTQSHLRFHIEGDPELQEALRVAGWTLDDLWREVGRTALLKRPLDEPWKVIHPPIRRLLYRHYYPDDDLRLAAHATARRFYETWTRRGAGKEQPVVLLECLWHEATQLMIRNREGIGGSSRQIRDILPGLAAELAGEFVKSPFYGPVELTDYVTGRLHEDEELQLMLREFDGLFENIVQSVVTTIAGGV